MDINIWCGIVMVVVMVVFLGVCFWIFSSKCKKYFDDVVNLLFVDDVNY